MLRLAPSYFLRISTSASNCGNETAFNLVAHELAHSLDYVLRDEMQEPSKSHDAFFQVLFEFMGGKPKYYFPENLGASLREKRTIKSFGGTGNVVLDF